ncbi:MAG: LysR family transcriptional regulator [Burkholderiaceae bacterium]|nr:MAG: LysR family transcriptional regulator [Burkholderiaceae bacterium]
MKGLDDLRFLTRAAQSASLSEAARAQGLSPAAASALLKRVEAELGCKLFVRSTRNLRLTPEGQAFLAQCREGLQMIDGARDRLSRDQGQLKGPLSIAMPSDLGRNVLLPWMSRFAARHPGLKLSLQCADRLAEVHKEDVDVAIRYGEPPASSLMALPLSRGNRRVLCASPAYLEAHGAPADPQALAAHRCLCFSLSGRVHDRWTFSRDGQRQVVQVKPAWAVDDGDVVRRLALAGEGVAYKSRLDVQADLQAGRLLPLCTDWLAEPAPLYLTCPDRHSLSPAVEALRTFLVERLQAVMPAVT